VTGSLNAGAAVGAVGRGGSIMSTEINSKSLPWNKGRLVGQKRPLRPNDVWAIRVRLD
jgi:hypothetical protein